MKGEAEAIYNAVRQDLIRIHANWLVFKQLYATSDDRLGTMNKTAPAFFRLIQDVLVDDAVISLSRLVDPSSDDTLLRLHKALKSQVNHAFYLELDQCINELVGVCSDIREHRHKRVAHKIRTSKHPDSSGHPIKLPSITRNKLEGAMESMAAFMNKVLGYFEDVDQMYEPFMDGDGDTLLLFLEKGLKTKRTLSNIRRDYSA